MKNTISINRIVSNEVENYISIDICTTEKRTHVEISLKDFTLALTGRSEVDCEVKEIQRKLITGDEFTTETGLDCSKCGGAVMVAMRGKGLQRDDKTKCIKCGKTGFITIQEA